MSLVRNYSIESVLKCWKEEAHVTRPIHYWYNANIGILTICSSDVGYLIGKQGVLVEKYRDILKNTKGIYNFQNVQFQEINRHYI